MGEVHRARAYGAAGVTKEICIKRIRQQRLEAPGALDAFVREARLSARLAHPNIVPVFDFGRSQHEYYLAMEWIDGVDLRALLDGPEPLEDYVIAYIVAGIARALDYAHQSAPDAPIVHRDVKPANVLISRHGDVHLSDFGVATLQGQAGGAAGTPGYMAPEVAEGRADVRSDLFSLGKLLERMGVGERAPLAGIVAQLTGGPDDRPLAAEVAEQLETYVAQIRGRGARSPRELLARRVAVLAPTASAPANGEALGRTHSFMHAEPTCSTAAQIRPAVPAPRGDSSKRTRWLLAGAAAVCVAGVVIWGAVGRDSGGPGAARSAAGRAADRSARSTEPAHEPAAHEPTAPEPTAPEPTAPEPTAPEPTAQIATAIARMPAPSPEVREPAPPPPERVAPRALPAKQTPSRAPHRRPPAPLPTAQPEPARPANALVSVNAIPWAQVSIDGTELGSTPLLDVALTPGTTHRIVLLNDVLGARAAREVLLEPGESRRVIIDLRPAQGQPSASTQTSPPAP